MAGLGLTFGAVSVQRRADPGRCTSHGWCGVAKPQCEQALLQLGCSLDAPVAKPWFVEDEIKRNFQTQEKKLASGNRLQASGSLLGTFLEPSGGFWGHFKSFFEAFGILLEHVGTPLAALWTLLGTFWQPFGKQFLQRPAPNPDPCLFGP